MTRNARIAFAFLILGTLVSLSAIAALMLTPMSHEVVVTCKAKASKPNPARMPPPWAT